MSLSRGQTDFSLVTVNPESRSAEIRTGEDVGKVKPSPLPTKMVPPQTPLAGTPRQTVKA